MNHVIYCPDVWLWPLIYSLFQVPSRLPVCAWTLTRSCDWIWRTMLWRYQRVRIITTILNVLFLLLFFSCPREIHDKIIACSCVCLPFEYPQQSGKWIEKKKKLTGCVRKEWMCVWKQLSARLSGNPCDSLKVQKQWHYCICLLSCVIF